MKLGGSLTRQHEEDMTVSDSSPHIANIGSMIEVRNVEMHAFGLLLTHSFIHSSTLYQDMENKMRNTLNELYFGKTKDIVNDLRC